MNEIICGDCLELMQEIPDASIDAIITDPPYAITGASWDQPIDWQAWWQEIRRIRKPAAPTVVFCSGKFCGLLWSTNPAEYRYDWIWVKSRPNQFFSANRRPMPIHEKIFVFSAKSPNYTPQKRIVRQARHRKHPPHAISSLYPHMQPDTGYIDDGTRCPTDVLYFAKSRSDKHPTAKPSALCEYLIRTYTDEGDIVLDPFCGGGAVPAAAMRANRHYIGMEKDPKWFDFACNRLMNEKQQARLSWW